jgi:hypothetical protein
MAVQFTYTDPYGSTHPEAYLRITDGSWSAASGAITASAAVWIDAQHAGDGLSRPVAAFSVSFPIDLNTTLNVFQQSYGQLKLDPMVAAGNPLDV